MEIGTSTLGDPIIITNDARRRHIDIQGATGTGKSTLLSHMMLSDIAAERPFALLDPHGDIAQYIADCIPLHLTNRTIYFDPLDATHVVGYNPLRTVPIGQRSQLKADIVATFHARWSDSWGHRMSYILGHAVRLLLDNPGSTLLDINVLLVNDTYRTRLLSNSTDPDNRRFWEREFAGYEKRFRLDAIAPIQNKAGVLSSDTNLRAVFGQSSHLDIAHLMNSGKFLIANLSKAMGEEPSALIGSFLTTAFAQAAQQRATIPEQERRDFTLYVDEFQNFATNSFASILSEARKYRLNLVLANQFLAQVPDELRRAVLGNVSTLIVFRVSAEDAAVLSREMGVNEQALADTPDFHAWVCTRAPSAAIRMESRPLPPPLGRFDAVRTRTHARHTTPRSEIEERFARSLNNT